MATKKLRTKVKSQRWVAPPRASINTPPVPAAPAPAATPAPVSTPAVVGAAAPVATPYDPFAVQAGDSTSTVTGIGIQNRGYAERLASITGAQKETERRLGVVESAVDPATGRRYRLDVESNPYSDAAVIQRQFQQRKMGDMNNAAQGGYLFDGAYSRAMQQTNFAEGQSTDALINRAMDAYGGYEGQRRDAYQTALDAITGYRIGDADRNALAVPAAPQLQEIKLGPNPPMKLPSKSAIKKAGAGIVSTGKFLGGKR